MEKISVIIPIYNTKLYVDACIRSVINQTYTNLEIICVDDGSTDGTSEILDEYAKLDDRIKVIHQENHGQSYSRKVGINAATGAICSLIDSDDWLELDMYEFLYHKMQNMQVDVACCALYMDKNGNKTVQANSVPEGTYFYDNIYKCLYDIENGKALLSWGYHIYLFKTDKIKKYVNQVPNDVEQGEDMIGTWSYLVNADSIYISNVPKYNYRLRNDSSSHKVNDKYLISVSKAYIILKKEFESKENKNELMYILKNAFFNIIQDNTMLTTEKQPTFLFPYEVLDRNKKIVLYGAGIVGKSYYRQLMENHYVKVSLWVDRSFQEIGNDDYPVDDPAKIMDVEYDYILISGVNEDTQEKIRKNLVNNMGIAEDKIIVCKAKRLSKYVNFN